MQQKIISGIDDLGMNSVVEWFNRFGNHKNTIVKIQLTSIDIEKIFNRRLFFKGDLTPENNCTYEELILEDVLDWNIFFPYQVKSIQLGHPIVLKRKLTHDDLFNVIYCYKGTLKAIKTLIEYNSLAWSSKANRTPLENKIISSMKNKRSIDFSIAKTALVDYEDYEIIDRIFDTEILEELIQEEQIPFKDLLEERLTMFTESQDQDSNSYLDDYTW